MGRIVLKNDWDLPPHYEKERGHFLGRKEELSKLVSEIVRRESGTILLSGQRGVGKTSLVYEALRKSKLEINARGGSKETVPVVLNASQLEVIDTNESSAVLREQVIKNLIRRLYTALPKSKTSKKIEDLYRKAVSSEVEIKQEVASDENESESSEKSRILSFGYDIKLATGITSVSLAFFIAAWHPFENTVWNTFLSTLALMPGAFAFMGSWSWIKKTLKQSSQKKSASEVYKQDASLGNLEFDLEKALAELCEKENLKIIFVIDELDKTKQDDVINIVQAFKNLFTLSPAIFIFVTGHEVFNRLEDSQPERSPEYTLFTTRIFVPRPAFLDIESFINEIVEKYENVDADIFSNYLCFMSKSDYFDLYSAINDLAVTNEGVQEINIELDASKILLANFQKALGLVFDLYKRGRPSNWPLNERLLTELYLFLDKFAQNEAGHQFEIEQQEGFIGDAVDSFAEYLSRLSAIVRQGERSSDIDLITGESKTFDQYQYTGKCKGVPKTLDTLLDYETKFRTSFNSLLTEILEIANVNTSPERSAVSIDVITHCNSLTGLDSSNIYQENVKVFRGLKLSPPDHFAEEDLSTRTTQINQHIKALQENRRIVIEKVLRQAHPDYVFQTLQENGSLMSMLGGIRQLIIDNGIKHILVARPDLSKQLLITEDVPEAMLDNGNRSNLYRLREAINILNVSSGSISYPVGNWYKSFFRNIDSGDGIVQLKKELEKINEWLIAEVSLEESSSEVTQPVD
ncbi:MAG: P-loop NTPase fold protein [Thermoleophilia bacterium]